MPDNIEKYGLVIVKVILTLTFVASGLAKLGGQEMMVRIFGAIGFGQWFRYLAGIIEVVGAALLWIRGTQFIGAVLLVCTTIGAVLAHLFVLGPPARPAALLGVLSAAVAYAHRDQSPFG